MAISETGGGGGSNLETAGLVDAPGGSTKARGADAGAGAGAGSRIAISGAGSGAAVTRALGGGAAFGAGGTAAGVAMGAAGGDAVGMGIAVAGGAALEGSGGGRFGIGEAVAIARIGAGGGKAGAVATGAAGGTDWVEATGACGTLDGGDRVRSPGFMLLAASGGAIRSGAGMTANPAPFWFIAAVGGIRSRSEGGGKSTMRRSSPRFRSAKERPSREGSRSTATSRIASTAAMAPAHTRLIRLVLFSRVGGGAPRIASWGCGANGRGNGIGSVSEIGCDGNSVTGRSGAASASSSGASCEAAFRRSEKLCAPIGGGGSATAGWAGAGIGKLQVRRIARSVHSSTERPDCAAADLGQAADLGLDPGRIPTQRREVAAPRFDRFLRQAHVARRLIAEGRDDRGKRLGVGGVEQREGLIARQRAAINHVTQPVGQTQ